MTDRDVGVVIVAAGSGSRTGSEELKQFRWVAGRPMLLHSLQEFQRRSDVCMVVVVLPRNIAGDPPPWLFQCDTERLLISVGGRERGESVKNGLEDLSTEAQIVVIHDAARPLVSAESIGRVIAAARDGDGAVAAIPVVDTLKRVDEEGFITDTIVRERLWRAQTPQAFPRAMILDAYARASREDYKATDDAALCERAGHRVRVVDGSDAAMKITSESDFAVAEALSMLPR